MTIVTIGKKWCSCIPQRYVIALLCFFGLFNAYAMRSCLSITMTKMTHSSKKPNIDLDDAYCTYEDFAIPVISTNTRNVSRKNVTEDTYDWNEYTQIVEIISYFKSQTFNFIHRVLSSSFYWGYVISHIPGSFIAEKYGGKHTFGYGILIAMIMTLLTPTAVYAGKSTALIILRAIMGLGEGVTIPASNSLIAKWTPPEERSKAASFIYASMIIGTIFVTIVSGWILEYSSTGWPLVFYVMGATGVVWYLIWLILCYDNPRDHPIIVQEEINYLRESMMEPSKEKPPPAPWRHILRSKHVWALVVALIGYDWMDFSMASDLNKYMRDVLKFSVENNGYFTSLIFFYAWLDANTTSWLIDYLIFKRNISTTLVRKVGSIFAMPLSAAFIVGASYAGCNRALVTAMFAMSMAFKGIAFPCLLTNTLDLSPNYASSVIGFTNGLRAWTGVVGPYIIGVLTPNQTLTEWRVAFWIMFGIASFCNLIFLVWGSGNVEYWNDPELVQTKVDQKNKRNINNAKI